MNQQIPPKITAISFGVMVIVFAVSFYVVAWQEPVLAGEGDNVSGWAWSENIGWISFNCNNPELPEPRCTYDYGVNIGEDGTLEGYAWSRGTTDDVGGIGWITFNENQLSGCPSSPCKAWVEEDGKVYGWARAYRPIEPEGQTLGGWTGWIKLRGIWTNPDTGESGPYGVEIDTNTGEFSGYAWGGGGESKESAVIGWISFNCANEDVCDEAKPVGGPSDYKVITSFSFVRPPDTPTNLSDSWNHCSYKGKSLPILSWSEFSHPDGKSQTGYEIQIGKDANLPDPPAGGEWREISTLATNSYTPSHRAEEWADWMDWNANYWWVVRVKDSEGNWSEWSNVKKMDEKSPRHAYPWPDFTWEPAEPSQKETVEFNPESSETFGGTSIYSYLWTVTKGEYKFIDDTTSESQYPRLQFSTSDNAVRLKITDTSPEGYSCTSVAKEIRASLPLPEYKEAPPIIWLKNMFASIMSFFNGLTPRTNG